MDRKPQAKSETAKLLIVEDHPLFRKGLTHLLESFDGMQICAEASDSAEATKAFAEHKPEFVILDLSLGGVLALDLIKQFRSMNPKAKILVVSMYDELTYAERSIRAGADGYVNKAEAAEKILEAL